MFCFVHCVKLNNNTVFYGWNGEERDAEQEREREKREPIEKANGWQSESEWTWDRVEIHATTFLILCLEMTHNRGNQSVRENDKKEKKNTGKINEAQSIRKVLCMCIFINYGGGLSKRLSLIAMNSCGMLCVCKTKCWSTNKKGVEKKTQIIKRVHRFCFICIHRKWRRRIRRSRKKNKRQREKFRRWKTKSSRLKKDWM